MTMLLSALDKKLLRDLRGLVGQVITIALVVACGIASYVTMRSAFDSLTYSKDVYYERYRFGDAFAHLERAPKALRSRIEVLPGVGRVEARIVEGVMVPMPGMTRPASGTVVSVPDAARPSLNDLHLDSGRWVDPTRDDEVMLLKAFAEAHKLSLGDQVPAVINGTLRELRIVGLAMSPEFVFTMPPGGMTYDPKSIAVLWMSEHAVSAAFQMEGGFNDVVVSLEPDASEPEVLSQLDRLLAPYGALGAIPRARQASNFMLQGELTQLEGMATVVPALFLFVAAFLLNVVLSRLVYLQRSQIATLKAVGYRDFDVGLHYVKLVSVIVLIGAVVGVALGNWLGGAMTDLYTGEYFRFPSPEYRLGFELVLTSVGISLVAALFGALAAARRVAALPPAEAMRPPAPTLYRRSLLERLGLFGLLGPSARMAVREIERRPLRLLLSSVGIALSVGIVVTAGYWSDAIDYMLDVQFHGAMREDVTVTFIKPVPKRALRELATMPGVWRAEGIRSVPVRFIHKHHRRDAVLNGYPEDLELRHLLNQDGDRVQVPHDGVMLTAKLAEVLDVEPGDHVTVELREGRRRAPKVYVADLVDEPFGMQGHMRLAAVSRLARDEPSYSSALLRVDPHFRDGVFERLKGVPWVAAVSYPGSAREQFEGQSGEIMRVYTLILALFASVIAVGVVYNNARIALSQRNRDLASLRVLGFTRGEIAAILFGELSVQVLLAIPLGFVAGHLMVYGLASSVDPETYRLPTFISTRTYAFAATVVILSALVSFALVRRKLNSLDLIAVLKTRE